MWFYARFSKKKNESYSDCRDERDDSLAVAERAQAYHGKNRIEFGRLLDLVQLIVYYAGSDLYKMAVLKLLFYIDFSYYRRTGQSVSGWRYARLPYGPVPDRFKEILFDGEQCGRFELVPTEDQLGELVVLPAQFDPSLPESDLSPSELEVVKAVVGKLARYSASELSALSHEEDAWIQTGHAQPIRYDYAATLKHGV